MSVFSCLFSLHKLFFLKELALSFPECLMVVGRWLQENDVKKGKEKMPQAPAKVINFSCIIFICFKKEYAYQI
jgi:hypothetical protein